MFANQLFLELEIIHAYATSLLTAVIGTATVVWQTKKRDDSVKAELAAWKPG